MLLMLEQIGWSVGAEFDEGAEVRVLAEATEAEALSEQIDQAVEVPARLVPGEDGVR